MTKRLRKVLAAVAAVSALALGGAVFANAQSSSPSEPVGGPDRDTVQQGDQTTPDTPATHGAASSEKPGAEGESAPNSDGPGGHADEANGGNAAADHQAQGVE